MISQYEIVVPVDIVLEVVVGRVHRERAEADAQAEEGLLDGTIPNDGVPEPVPLRSEEVDNAVECAFGG